LKIVIYETNIIDYQQQNFVFKLFQTALILLRKTTKSYFIEL